MSLEQKEMERYLDGLVILFHVVNNEDDLNKASDIIHDLLLGYDVAKDHEIEFKKGYEDVKEIFIDFPREDNMFFDKNDSLKDHLEKYE